MKGLDELEGRNNPLDNLSKSLKKKKK